MILTAYLLKTALGFLFLIFSGSLIGSYFPPHVKASFNSEIEFNSAFSTFDIRAYAAGVYRTKQGVDFEEAVSQVELMTPAEALAWALQEFPLAYLEIPVRELGPFKVKHSEIRNGNVQYFEREGIFYVRWFIHPLNNSVDLPEKFLKFKKTGRFFGLLSASRSLAVFDSKTRVLFGIKMTLNKAFGPFGDRIFTTKKANFHHQVSAVLMNEESLQSQITPEQSYVGIIKNDFDQAQQVRNLSFLTEKSLSQYPLFVFVTENSLSRDLAKINNFSNSSDFLRSVLAPELGVVAGKLYAHFGFVHRAFHSQNLVALFDKNRKFVGVKLRDADIHIEPDFFKIKYGGRALAHLGAASDDFVSADNLFLDFSIVNGLRDDIISTQQKFEILKNSGDVFFASFLKTVVQARGLQPLEALVLNQVAQLHNKPTLMELNGGQRAFISWGVEVVEEIVLSPRNRPYSKSEKGRVKKALVVFLEGNTRTKEWLYKTNNQLLNEAWNELTFELEEKGEFSDLGRALNSSSKQNKSSLLASLFSKYQFLGQSKLLESIIYHRLFIIQNEPYLLNAFQRKAVSEFVWKDYLAMIDKGSGFLNFLWSSREQNGLLELPQSLLKEYFSTLTVEQRRKIRREVEQNETQSTALQDIKLSQNKQRLIESLNQIREPLREGGTCLSVSIKSRVN